MYVPNLLPRHDLPLAIGLTTGKYSEGTVLLVIRPTLRYEIGDAIAERCEDGVNRPYARMLGSICYHVSYT